MLENGGACDFAYSTRSSVNALAAPPVKQPQLVHLGDEAVEIGDGSVERAHDG